MPPVSIRQKRIWVGDTPYAFLSGEIHFWRLNPRPWRAALQAARDMGLSLIASYVCWQFHELGPGEFDFRGETDANHDLVAFIQMVANEDLKLLIRPGPYIYSEWPNGGVPDRCVQYHRLHPDFQREAARYLTAVVEVIRPYLATQGGPITLVQAENEPHPWPHIYERQLGLAQEPGPFQAFLQTRYQTIDALNAAWETDLADFDQARSVTQPLLQQRGYYNRYLDYLRFQQAYTAEVIHWTAAQYRDLGIDVPLITNVYSGEGVQNWHELEMICDLAGPDLYPSNEFHLSQTELFKEFLHPLRYTRTYSALPAIPEFQAGIWHGGHQATGSLTPNHYRMASCAALLAGVAGWNWYMLVNRDNWLMSPVNEWGAAQQDLFPVFRQIVRLFHVIDPPALRKITSTAVTVDVLHQMAHPHDHSDALLQALNDADIDYECFDLDTGELNTQLLFYGGGAWLSRQGQQQLRRFVTDGGMLVFFQDWPYLDDSLAPLNVVELRSPVGVLGATHPQQIAIRIGESIVTTSAAFFVYDSVPGEPILAERIADRSAEGSILPRHISLPVGTTYTIGYRQPVGKGCLISLGVPPTPELVCAIHNWLGVPIASRAISAAVNTALFENHGTFYLVAVNQGAEPRDVRIELNPALFDDNPWEVRDLFDDQATPAYPGRDGQVWLHLDRKSGTVARIAPATPRR